MEFNNMAISNTISCTVLAPPPPSASPDPTKLYSPPDVAEKCSDSRFLRGYSNH